MWLKEMIHRARSRRVDSNGEGTSVPDRPKRDVAIVIAGPELAAAVSELYQAHGYEVFVPQTPRDVIDTLDAVGDHVRAVLISSEAGWASHLRELIADECPKLERVSLLS